MERRAYEGHVWLLAPDACDFIMYDRCGVLLTFVAFLLDGSVIELEFWECATGTGTDDSLGERKGVSAYG